MKFSQISNVPRWQYLIALAFACAWVILPASGKIYVVQKNDTLSRIALRHNCTVEALAKANKLSQPDRIYIGQRILIPSRRHPLPPELEDKLQNIKVEDGKWKFIVIHHSASARGNAKSFDRYHREERHMENGLAYHFVIGNSEGMKDGEIAIGNRWRQQIDGGHLASLALNQKSIGICLVGDFDQSAPTKKQMESLKALVGYLLERCELPTSAVKTHQRINTVFTRCPGRRFPMKQFMDDLQKGQSLQAAAK